MITGTDTLDWEQQEAVRATAALLPGPDHLAVSPSRWDPAVAATNGTGYLYCTISTCRQRAWRLWWLPATNSRVLTDCGQHTPAQAAEALAMRIALAHDVADHEADLRDRWEADTWTPSWLRPNHAPC
ncbi:hypothetical protein [Streptomyces sp. NRRL S-350]|uniref:hypothetical protein n=1 Tax=Streptomyces sp. NRRL S-350 TaxID=1463902 RepID=UPI0004C06871|nr:hypothetical protein [Streptomyces sp. NRRL S-350]